VASGRPMRSAGNQGQKELKRRATSCLLAVRGAGEEFGGVASGSCDAQGLCLRVQIPTKGSRLEVVDPRRRCFVGRVRKRLLSDRAQDEHCAGMGVLAGQRLGNTISGNSRKRQRAYCVKIGTGWPHGVTAATIRNPSASMVRKGFESDSGLPFAEPKRASSVFGSHPRSVTPPKVLARPVRHLGTRRWVGVRLALPPPPRPDDPDGSWR
jgi:hypothetical protein